MANFKPILYSIGREAGGVTWVMLNVSNRGVSIKFIFCIVKHGLIVGIPDMMLVDEVRIVWF